MTHRIANPLADLSPATLTAALAGAPGFQGRIVRSLWYEEVASAPGSSDSVTRVHLTFADATRASVVVERGPPG